MTTTDRTPSTVPTLVAACRGLAERAPDDVSHAFYADGQELREQLTFAELDRRARVVAAELARHAEPGDRALLRYPAGTEFVVGFVGCLYAGLTAVPATPLGSVGGRTGGDRSEAIARNARPRLLLSTGPELADAATERGEVVIGEGADAIRMRAVDTADLGRPDGTDGTGWAGPSTAPPPVAVDPDTPAYLQYSSGSAGSPKGVVLTHGNVVHNLSVIVEMLGVQRDGVSVSWLPVFHDMGLVAGALIPLWAGCPSRLMSPAAFLQRPLRWLGLLAGTGEHPDVHTAAPNFAYDLCVRRLGGRPPEDLDLSAVRSMIVGAEPVRARSLRGFAEAFAPAGLAREALLPCYGLAESTLMVTGGPRGRGPVVRRVDTDGLRRGRVEAVGDTAPQGRDTVGCGTPRPGMRVVLAAPDGTGTAGPGEVGEICVQGPSVGRGYFDSPDSAATFEGFVDGVEGPVMRTGDLGFVLDGELFVAGRQKDVLVIDGTNHHPSDLEASLTGVHDALAPDRAAVIATDAGDREQVVVVAELTPRASRDGDEREEGAREVGRAVRQALSRDHGVPVHDVVLLPPGRLPYTSSGKVQRLVCRTRYADGGFDAVRLDAPTEVTAR